MAVGTVGDIRAKSSVYLDPFHTSIVPVEYVWAAPGLLEATLTFPGTHLKPVER